MWMCFRHYKELFQETLGCFLLSFVCITETTRSDYKKRNEKPAAAIALLMYSEAWAEAWGMPCDNGDHLRLPKPVLRVSPELMTLYECLPAYSKTDSQFNSHVSQHICPMKHKELSVKST